MNLFPIFLAGAMLLPLLGSAQETPAGVRGSADAVTAAERLLQHVGGAGVWTARLMEVTERAYSPNGDEVELRIVRDFAVGSRLLERRSQAGLFVEWVSAERGWVREGGTRRTMRDSERIAQQYGLKQEPYAIFHRLARRDAGLRVELRERTARLVVYDKDERVLCWFRLDAKGRPIGWGNFFDGQINEHYYGPLQPFGNVSLPRWGVSTTGAFRFEYVSAKLSDRPLDEP